MNYMKDKIFIDTNIFIYLFDISSPTKQKISKDIIYRFLNQNNYLINTHVVGEIFNILVKKGYTNFEDAQRFVINLFKCKNIAIIEKNTVIKAIDIKKRFGLQFWDSLIISSALENDCTIFYTEDMQDELVIDGMSLHNPYK